MTQEQQKQTEVIAVYDGWRFRNNNKTAELYKGGEFIKGFHDWQDYPREVFKYHESDDWIMPVARKVWKELNDLLIADIFNNDLLDMVQEFEFSAFQSTAELCTEVYHGIIYLQSLKSKQ